MFSRLDDDETQIVAFSFEGEHVLARKGDSIAAALLSAGHEVFRRTPVSGAPRGPYCMMGVCFECLVSIDDGPPIQGCMMPVREGMEVRGVDAATERTP